MSVTENLEAAGLTLPDVASPVGAYVPAVSGGGLVTTSGQLPTVDGTLLAEGKVSGDVSLETAQQCARQAALNAIAAMATQVDSLDRVTRILRVTVYVNSSPGFTDQAQVANGASEVLAIAFGDVGRHTRCAVGVAELPLDAPVEVDVIAAVS
jgi:enamine deaminase RidA (YjgF/YER057c/UK114 family)